jgi:hypothetical protein
VAHLIGVASPILVSYYAHKHFSFRPAGGESPLGQTEREIAPEV